ncbi:MAG: ABC transporter permease [Gemmatimonadota bacterium]
MAKEFRHILRDRRTLAILLLLPLAQVLLFGFAVRTDIRGIRVAVVDPSPDAASLSLQAVFQGTDLFQVVAVVGSVERLPPLFQRGAIDQALVFPPDFARALGRPGGATVQVITDASDPNTGSTMRAYADRVVEGWRSRALPRAGGTARYASGPVPPTPGGVRIEPRVRMRFNPTLESVNLFVPGLIAVLLTVVSALMSAISLSREKETGTLEVLLVSPLRPWQIIAGKLLPYMTMGFLNLASVLLAARLVFGVPFRGSLPLLVAESLLFILASMGLGVLIAARTSTQRTAMVGALMGLMLPTLLLSGMIFPISSMPGWLQALSNVVPGRWFLLVARGIMLKGVGLAELWQETAILSAMTAGLIVASIRAFNVRLD